MSSGSDSGSNASGSRSASPAASQNSERSRSASPAADNASAGSRSRSPSAGSNKSGHSVASSRSRQSRSRSHSNESNRSGGSNASHRSGGSHASDGSNRSGGSRRSNRSSSNRSSPAKPQSPAGSAKSGSTNRSRSRSSSPGEGNKNSDAGSNKSSRSNSRSRSASPHQDSKRKTDSDDEKEKKNDKAAESEVEGEGPDKEVSAAAIFGDDADDISSEEEKEKEQEQQDDEKQARSDGENENEEDPEVRQDEGDNEPETIPETRIDVQIPKITCDLGRDIHFVKLPNFLSVETRPFDPETYEDEIDEEETLDEEGRARLKLKVENTIRWREVMDKEGNISKQSNARLVRWSDGSYSLHLGSEIFDVYKQPLQGDHNHLFIRQGTGLQGQAVFRTKLSFRPHSTESFTHRKMTLSLADRSQKISGIKILSQVGADPDHDRKTLLKKEEEKLRQTVRATKPRKKGDTVTRLHMNSSTYREDEGSDEDGAISLNAIKNKYKSGAAATAKGGAIYSSDEDGSDIEARRARKMDKALKDSDSSAESE